MRGYRSVGLATDLRIGAWTAILTAFVLSVTGCLSSKDSENLPPRISVNDLHPSLLRNETYRDTLRRIDGKSGKLELKLEKGPDGAVLQDSIVTWRVNDVGDAQFTASAIDNETGLQFVFTWFVHADYENFPPQIRDTAATMLTFGIVGERYVDTLRIFDFNADVPNLGNPEKFPWITFQDSIFFIRPGPADTGTHHVSIVVEDGKGGADTIAWTLRISKDDKEVCGFRNLKVGTSWVYHGTSPAALSLHLINHYDTIRIQSESKIGDTSVYMVRQINQTVDFNQVFDHSFQLSAVGEAILARNSNGSDISIPGTFAMDCGKEYQVSRLTALGDNTLAMRRILTWDSLGNPVDQEIWVLGVGLVYSYRSAKPVRYSSTEVYTLVRFKERNVIIRSLDPLDMVYE